MIRHISLFRLLKEPANGKTMEENGKAMVEFLRTLPEKNPAIISCQAGLSLGGPDGPPDAPVMFTHVAQVIDFADMEGAMAYPASEAHTALVEFSAGVVEKVVAIDYEI